MATLLERSMYPEMDSGGLTSGVDYFGNVGRGRNAALNINRGPRTIASAEDEPPPGTGFVSAPPETGFGGSRGDTGGDSSGFSSSNNQPMSREQANTMGLAGGALGLYGAAAQDPAAGFMGRTLGSAAAASQGNYMPGFQQALSMVGQPEAAQAAGLLATGLGAYRDYNSDPVNNANVTARLQSQAINTAVNMNPVGRLANFGLQAGSYFGGDTSISVGDIASFGFRDYGPMTNLGPVDAAQVGRTIAYSADPAATTRAMNMNPDANNPQALSDAARAMSYGVNRAVAPGMTVDSEGRVVSNNRTIAAQDFGTFGVQSDVGSYGLPTRPAAAAAAAGGDPNSVAGRYGTNPGSQQTGMLGAQEAGFGSSRDPNSVASRYGTNPGSQQTGMLGAQEAGFGSGGGGGGGGRNSDGSSGPGDSSGRSSGGGRGADGWKDGGMIGDMPGITQRYMDGGPVQGGPLLAMGYADGGMMGQMGGKPTPATVNRQVDAMLRDPRARQTLLARPQQLMASGELTPDEVTTMGRVAEAALFSPELYPQLRQFVAEQGMNPLPAAFDPSVIMRIMAIARGLQQETPAGQVPGTDQAQMQRPVPGEGNGGYLQGPGTGRSDSIGTVNETTGEPVKVANGEYVIPAHVVRAKGREFFDNLLRRYSDVPKGE